MTKSAAEGGPIWVAPQGQASIRVSLQAAENPYIDPMRWPFIYLSPSHPALVKLREQERLDEVVAPARSEFEKILLLKRWAGTVSKYLSGKEYPSWKAVEFLERARAGDDIILACGQFSMLLLQACASMGLLVRYIELGTKSNPYAHFSTEAYLSEYGKWVVMDPTPAGHCNGYLTRDGVPLTALEVHQAYIAGDWNDIIPVHDPEVVDPQQDRPLEEFIGLYYYFRILFTQDHLTVPPFIFDNSNTFDRHEEAVEWENEFTVPWEENPETRSFLLPHRRMTRRRTNRPEDLYWRPTNQTTISMRWFDGNRFVVHLGTNCPDFETFLVRLDEGEWHKRPASFPWQLTSGSHTIEARTRTQAGSLGPISWLRFNVSKV